MNTEEETRVDVRSGFGANLRAPFVELQIGDYSIQMAPPKAREIAMMLLEAAEGADTDAMVMEVLDGDDRTAIQLLRLFRGWRQERRQERDHADRQDNQ